MKKLLTSIWLGLMFFAWQPAAQAEYASPTARLAMVNWVVENAPGQRVAKKSKAVKRVSVAEAQNYVSLAVRWAAKRDLDPMLVLSIMRHESGFNPNARSPYGAMGLMQVVPRWHRDKLQGRNLYHPEVAIEVGTKVLQDCFTKFNGHTFKALRCYLGGNPDRYYKNIHATHTAMGRTVVQTWFVAEEPIRDLPRMSMASVAVPSYPAGRATVYALAYTPPSRSPQYPSAEDRLALDRLAMHASMTSARMH